MENFLKIGASQHGQPWIFRMLRFVERARTHQEHAAAIVSNVSAIARIIPY
jgi:hypothetical protein